MLLETFRGRSLPRVLAQVRAAYGEDAMILRTRCRKDGTEATVEVVATTDRELVVFRRRIERPPPRVSALAKRGAGGPRVVALVGPTGAGKTTTAAKLAMHPDGYGGRRVGLITLDTYRVAALEQIETYAEIMGLPLEVIYAEAEVDAAMDRFAECDVVLVDTPGRGPKRRGTEQGHEWRDLLRRIDPDEVHLVLPAGLRADVALALRDDFASCGTTHMLLTKLDEVPGEWGVAQLAEQVNLPARWVATGQEVPTDLHKAGARLLASLCGGAGADVAGVAAVAS